MNFDEFMSALKKLRQIRTDLPVIIFDPDTNERMEVQKVSIDLQHQVTLILKRR